MLVFTLGVRALGDRPRFEPFLDHVAAAAFGAFLGQGLAPRNEVAFGVTVTAVEGLPAFGASLNDVALMALGTGDAYCFLLYILARGVIATSGKLAEAALFKQ